MRPVFELPIFDLVLFIASRLALSPKV
uniref:Uncharacterized protein n=1 Tax=Rhizophora mucronata TaxID=61149 RepID=A0A2P2P220_RHIMU